MSNNFNAEGATNPELAFALECTKSISWKIYLDTDTVIFSDNFETLYGIHQADYNHRFGRFLDRHLNPHKEQILESIDLYLSGEADSVAIGEITLFDDKRKLNWLHATGKCINENQEMIYGVSVDITERKNGGQEPNQNEAGKEHEAASNNTTSSQKTTSSAKTLLISKLSRREQDIINALLAGNVSHKDLTNTLCISRNTLKTHLSHIYRIAGVPSMTALLSLLHASRGS